MQLIVEKNATSYTDKTAIYGQSCDYLVCAYYTLKINGQTINVHGSPCIQVHTSLQIPKLTVTADSTASVYAEWTDMSDAVSYEIACYSSAKGAPATDINGQIITARTVSKPNAVISGLVKGKTYYFQVTARTKDDRSVVSQMKSLNFAFTKIINPVVKATRTGYNQIHVTWSNVPGGDAFSVIVAPTNNKNNILFSQEGLTDGAAGCDVELPTGTTAYSVTVTAFNRECAFKSTGTVKITLPVLAKPKKATAAAGIYGTVDLTWP